MINEKTHIYYICNMYTCCVHKKYFIIMIIIDKKPKYFWEKNEHDYYINKYLYVQCVLYVIFLQAPSSFF
jgi:hypothetical protein